jgi:hypothetical protein
MLRAEKDLSERDGIVIWEPGQGLAYQISGALQRLGSRLIALSSGDSQSFKNLPMQTWKWNKEKNETDPDFKSPFTSAVIIPDENLEASLKVRDEILKTNTKTRFVWVLPQSHQEGAVQKWASFFNALNKNRLEATDFVFWTPPTFGFRDPLFFDQLIAEKTKRPGLFGLKEPEIPLEIIFSGDLASFVAGFFFAPKNTIPLKQINHFWLAPLKVTWPEFLNQFKSAFGFENPGFLEKFASRIEASSLANVLGLKNPPTPLLSLETLQNVLGTEHFMINALDYFPSQLTSTSRALNHLARVYRKDPNLELVFPPGSTP